MIGQIDVLSYDAPHFFSDGTFSKIFTFLGSFMIPLLQAHFLSPCMADSSTREYHRMSTRVSRSVSGSEMSP